MYCWGNNRYRQLGLTDKEEEEVGFTENDYFNSQVGVRKVASGGSHTLFLLEDGIVHSCGQNNCGQLGRRSNNSSLDEIYSLEAQLIVDVSCGVNHSVAICNEGNIFSWGEGSQGQLGSGQFPQQSPIPRKISGLSDIRIIQISCGHFHTVALSEDSNVFSWGKNDNGQLGLGKQTPNQASPQLVKFLKGVPLVQVSVGRYVFKPHAISSLREKGVIYISCGDEHTAVLCKEGTVYTFGNGTLGQTHSITLMTDNMLTICRINETLVKTWIDTKPGKPNRQDAKREIIKIFSSPACLTASFLKNRDSSSDPSLPIVDLSFANDIFTELCQHKWIADIICSSLKNELIPATGSLPNLFEALSVFLLFPECPIMHDANLAAELVQAIDNLSLNAKKMLETLWSSLPEPNLKKQIQMFKIALILCVFQKKDSIKHVLEALKQLYRANMKAGYKVPISYFCVPEVSHAIIIPADLNNWRIYQKQSQADGTMDPEIYCRYPYIFTFATKVLYLNTDAMLKKNPSVDKKMYYQYGVLCGLAVFNETVIYLPFPLALFKKLLGKKITLEDLKELQPTMGKSMQCILDTEKDVESLDLHFTLSWENQTVQLIPNGAAQRVTHLNKYDFVNKCLEYIFNTSVTETFEEFKKGFYKVCDKDILLFFQPEELMNVVAGHANYDWSVFEKNTVYTGKYSPTHPTIIMFWNVFHQLPLAKKKAFLYFITGNDRISVFGLQNTVITVSSFGVPNECYLPEANTCSQLLHLPEYSKKDVLRRKLLLAMENNKGFEKN
ncbi:hypothetical protein GDO81_000806 [Engystomops pustulosus]|uniref:HECT domain-containing protein n=1 Tax=Engystomops pustulosus TaxID=76066 RepID=A0AAV7D7F9_ENGPU|nr:hypothetical protein GDO81_000806 [Engystomops pustulosus]